MSLENSHISGVLDKRSSIWATRASAIPSRVLELNTDRIRASGDMDVGDDSSSAAGVGSAGQRFVEAVDELAGVRGRLGIKGGGDCRDRPVVVYGRAEWMKLDVFSQHLLRKRQHVAAQPVEVVLWVSCDAVSRQRVMTVNPCRRAGRRNQTRSLPRLRRRVEPDARFGYFRSTEVGGLRLGMEFSREWRSDVPAGDITLTVRLWKRPRVRTGRDYRVGLGEIEVDAAELVPCAEITPAEVQRAGEPDRESLRERAAHAGPIADDTLVYRIAFHGVDRGR